MASEFEAPVTRRRLLRSGAALGGVCFCLLLVLLLRNDDQSGDRQPHLRAIRASIDEGRYAEAEQRAQSLYLVTGKRTRRPVPGKWPRRPTCWSSRWCATAREPSHGTRALAEQAIRAGEAQHGAGPTVHLSSGLQNLGERNLCRPVNTAWHNSRTNEVCASAKRISVRIIPTWGITSITSLACSPLLERFDEALAASDRALQIKEKTLPRDDLRIARTLEIRASLLQRRGGEDPRAALDVDRAWAIRESIDPTHPEAAGTLSLIGAQRRLKSNIVQAKEFSSRALAVAQKSLRPDHPDIATYTRGFWRFPSNLWGISRKLGYFASARLSSPRTSLGADHLAVAVHLNDLANSRVAEGEYTEGAYAFRGGFREDLRATPRTGHSGVTTSYLGSRGCQRVGLAMSARLAVGPNRAIATWSRLVGPEHPFVALALFRTRPRFLSDQGLHAEARTVYQRALAIRERTLGKNSTELAQILTSLSVTTANLGQKREAYELSSRALKIWEQSSGRDTREAAEALRAHGSHQSALGDHMAARNSYDRAMVIVRRNMVSRCAS